MRKIISLFLLLLPVLSSAEPLTINAGAPDNYTVVRGDTLWDISAKFYAHPWQWPIIWGFNKDTIKNPHWIYPGDLIHLDRTTGTLQVTPAADPSKLTTNNGQGNNPTFKLSPQRHIVDSQHDAIPPIPLKEIAPFLARPLIVDDATLSNAPKIIGGFERRSILATNDLAYVESLPDNLGTQWQVFRAGQTLIDPVTHEALGNEVIYLGDAEVEKFDSISQLRIIRAQMEIIKGDLLAQPATDHAVNYQPHAPISPINAQIISIYGGMAQVGKNAVITLNKGQREGLENGHILALYKRGEKIKQANWFKADTVLPDHRFGLVIVFRVFEKVSYALILQSELPVNLQDGLRTP
ncbi:MAG: hypothetical protein RLZZ144_796 [Pseudomonadota bacterium]|jgi:hypothetical protein